MKIEAGKTYYMRDGGVAGPMEIYASHFQGWATHPDGRKQYRAWGNDGDHCQDEYNLTSEVAALEAPARTPHKHAEVIKAWADGAEIEFKYSTYPDWEACPDPKWQMGSVYRIKPAPVPNVVTWHPFYAYGSVGAGWHVKGHAAKATKAPAILRLEIDHTNPASPVLVSATLERP